MLADWRRPPWVANTADITRPPSGLLMGVSAPLTRAGKLSEDGAAVMLAADNAHGMHNHHNY